MDNEILGTLLVGWFIYLIIFKFVGAFPVSKVLMIALIVGAIIAPTQTKTIMYKSVDFIHISFGLITHYVTTHAK